MLLAEISVAHTYHNHVKKWYISVQEIKHRINQENHVPTLSPRDLLPPFPVRRMIRDSIVANVRTKGLPTSASISHATSFLSHTVTLFGLDNTLPRRYISHMFPRIKGAVYDAGKSLELVLDLSEKVVQTCVKIHPNIGRVIVVEI
jgi:hypothetical protein